MKTLICSFLLLLATGYSAQNSYKISPALQNLDGSDTDIIARLTEENYTFDVNRSGWKITLFNSFTNGNEKFLEFETININFENADFYHEYINGEIKYENIWGKKQESIFSKNLTLKSVTSDTDLANNMTLYMDIAGGYPKYEIFIEPDAFENISFKIDKPAKINENGELVIQAELGKIILEKPSGILKKVDGNQNINIDYVLDGNRVSFTSKENYWDCMILNIDPIIRIESSYYGGLGQDRFYDSGRDAEGNYYLAGVTSSAGNIAFNGHQTIKNDFEDAFLVKINSSGERQWATYYGGDGIDIAYGVGVNNDGRVVIAGETFSVENISTVGSHQEEFGGGFQDGFLATFDSEGNLLWGSYYGGYQNDKLNDVFLDEFGNSYVCGFSNSDNNIFAGGYQATRNGDYDAIIAKFNPLGERRWGTYYGGEDEDYLESIVLDSERNIYFGGSTKSETSISKNAYQSSISDEFDSFTGKMDNNGNLTWCTYFGNIRSDLGNCVSVSGGNLLLGGSTQSNGMGIGGHQTDLAGSFDGFYALFDDQGSFDHSSYFGGFQNDEIRGSFLSDNAIYIAGSTRSNDNIAFNAYQEFRAGKNDGIFAKYDLNGELKYSSYYGGAEVDVIRSIRIDSDTLFTVGFTSSADSISQNGFQNNLAGEDDGFFAFFTDELPDQIETEFSNTYCADESYSTDFNLIGEFPNPTKISLLISDRFGDFANGEILAEGDFDPSIENTIDFSLPSTLSLGSSYKMKLVSDSPEVESNTISKNILIIPLPSLSNKLDSYCEDSKFDLNANVVPSMTYDWTFPDGTVQEDVNKIQIFHDEPGVYAYQVTQSGHGCQEKLEFTINVVKSPEISIVGPKVLCRGAEVDYEVNTVVDNSGKPILWTLEDLELVSGTLNITRKIKVRATGDNPKISVQFFGLNDVCNPKAEIDLEYYDETAVKISGSDQTCKNCTETYFANLDNGIFNWEVTGGEIIGSSQENSVEVRWSEVSVGNIKLFHESANGCISADQDNVVLSDNIEIAINPEPDFVCEGETTQFATSSATFLSNTWEVEGGTLIDEKDNSITVYWSDDEAGKIILKQENQNTSITQTKSIDIVVRQKIEIVELIEDVTECVDIENELRFENIPGAIFRAEIDNGSILENNEGSIKFSFDNSGESNLRIIANRANDGCDSIVNYNYNVSENTASPKLVIQNKIIRSDIPAYFLKDGEQINSIKTLEIEPEFNGKYEAFTDNEIGCRSDISNAIYVSFLSILDFKNGIKIFPNPANKFVNIELEGEAKINMIDVNGKLKLSKNISGSTRINLSDYQAGFYILQLEINGDIYRSKLIIQ